MVQKRYYCLITPNSVNVASVMCGTLYAGGVACPLNHLSAVVELAQYLKASIAKAMVTNVECQKVVQEATEMVGMSNKRILLIDKIDHTTGCVGGSSPLRRFRRATPAIFFGGCSWNKQRRNRRLHLSKLICSMGRFVHPSVSVILYAIVNIQQSVACISCFSSRMLTSALLINIQHIREDRTSRDIRRS